MCIHITKNFSDESFIYMQYVFSKTLIVIVLSFQEHNGMVNCGVGLLLFVYTRLCTKLYTNYFTKNLYKAFQRSHIQMYNRVIKTDYSLRSNKHVKFSNQNIKIY